MSEYPISCDKCGKYIGYVHVSEWSPHYVCDECRKELKKEVLGEGK